MNFKINYRDVYSRITSYFNKFGYLSVFKALLAFVLVNIFVLNIIKASPHPQYFDSESNIKAEYFELFDDIKQLAIDKGCSDNKNLTIDEWNELLEKSELSTISDCLKDKKITRIEYEMINRAKYLSIIFYINVWVCVCFHILIFIASNFILYSFLRNKVFT